MRSSLSPPGWAFGSVIALALAGCGGGSASIGEAAGSTYSVNGFSTRGVLSTGPVIAQSADVTAIGIGGSVNELTYRDATQNPNEIGMVAVDASRRLLYIDPDPSLPERVLANAVQAFEPHVSPNGLRVAYTMTNSGGLTDIQTVAVAGGPPTTVTRGAKARYSPDGTNLAFIRTGVPDTRVFTSTVSGASVTDRASLGFVDIDFADVEWYDNNILLASDGSGMVKIINLSAGSSIDRTLPVTGLVTDLEFSPDRTRLLVVTSNGITLLPVRPDLLLDGYSQTYSNSISPVDVAWIGNNNVMGIPNSDPRTIRVVDATQPGLFFGVNFRSNAAGREALWDVTALPTQTNRPILTAAPYTSGAAGFVIARTRGSFTSAVLFDIQTRTSTRVALEDAPPGGMYSGGSGDMIFNVEGDRLTNLHLMVEKTFRYTSVLPTGTFNGALITIGAGTGQVDLILPYSETRSGKPKVKRENGRTVFTGTFGAAIDGQGKNLAEGGASEVVLEGGRVQVR